jgi:hypothetical protein
MKKISILRSCLIGALPLAGLLISVPSERAHAQFSDIFGAVVGTENSIGDMVTGINQSVSSMDSLRKSVIAPVNDLQAVQNNGTNIVNTYRSWMSNVYSAPITSGLTPNVQSLEAGLFQASSISLGSTPSISLSNLFNSVYGQLPTNAQVPSSVATALDMTDASARNAMVQSVYGDATADGVIALGHTLEDQALTTSSGSAPQIEAQALASAVQSLAVEHKLYAAELRTISAQLAAQGTKVKQGAVGAGLSIDGLGHLIQSAAAQ